MTYLISNPKKNSWLVLVIFSSTLLFQVTTLKSIWGIEYVARISNTLALGYIVGYLFLLIPSITIKSYYSYIYILSVFFINIGTLLNYIISILSNPDAYIFVGNLMTWVVYIIIPILMRRKEVYSLDLWRYYYYYFGILDLFGIVEYHIVYPSGIGLRQVETNEGSFMAGVISLFHAVDSGELHYRFYGAFPEPGTLAMLTLPAIVYGLVYKNYLLLPVFFYALYLADSLGGYVGALTIFLIYFIQVSKKFSVIIRLMTLFGVLIFFVTMTEKLQHTYDDRAGSATTREDGVVQFFENIPALLMTSPFGIERGTTSAQSVNLLYSPNTFSIAAIYFSGGILAFIGYISILFLSIFVAVSMFFKRNLSLEGRCVSISILVLFPFIFQRMTVWEMPLFPLMFMPYLLSSISNIHESS